MIKKLIKVNENFLDFEIKKKTTAIKYKAN